MPAEEPAFSMDSGATPRDRARQSETEGKEGKFKNFQPNRNVPELELNENLDKDNELSLTSPLIHTHTSVYFKGVFTQVPSANVHLPSLSPSHH